MSKLLWKAVKCDTISNAGAYAPKMAGVACAHTSGVSSRVTGRHEHLPVSIFAKFWPILAYFAYKWTVLVPVTAKIWLMNTVW